VHGHVRKCRFYTGNGCRPFAPSAELKPPPPLASLNRSASSQEQYQLLVEVLACETLQRYGRPNSPCGLNQSPTRFFLPGFNDIRALSCPIKGIHIKPHGTTGLPCGEHREISFQGLKQEVATDRDASIHQAKYCLIATRMLPC
jgi:hypothetical protein